MTIYFIASIKYLGAFLCLAVLVQYSHYRLQRQLVTDGQSEGLTHDDSIYCASIASRGKNGHHEFRIGEISLGVKNVILVFW